MDVNPVKDAQPPKYPLKEEVSGQQIKAGLPQRWAGSRAAKIALGTLAAMTVTALTACDAAPEGAKLAPTVTATMFVQAQITQYLPEGTTAPGMLSVAPLFQHGEGMGAFGCDMVTPPAFLSEEEALLVINTVAKEYGLVFSAGGAPSLENVRQPVTNIYEPEKKQATDTLVTWSPDFADTDHGIMLEFVSVEDVKSWHQETGYGISVESYDALDAAEQLSESIETALPQSCGFPVAGVLYDPCEQTPVKNGEDWQAAEAQSRAQSEAELSKQVKDFLEWLKTEGVI